MVDIEFRRAAGAEAGKPPERLADWTARALSPRGADWLHRNRVGGWLTRGEAAWLRAKAEAEGLDIVTDG